MNGALQYAEQKLGMSGDHVETALDEAWRNGMTAEQAMFMLEKMPQVEQGQNLRSTEDTLRRIEISEQVLKNVWGNNFEGNVQKLEQFAYSKYPQDAQSAEQLLTNILSDTHLAQTTLNGMGMGNTGMGQASPGAPLPQQGQPLDEASDLAALEKAWTDLKTDPKSPLYARDYQTREPAMKELNRIAKIIYDRKIGQNRGFGGGFSNSM